MKRVLDLYEENVRFKRKEYYICTKRALGLNEKSVRSVREEH